MRVASGIALRHGHSAAEAGKALTPPRRQGSFSSGQCPGEAPGSGSGDSHAPEAVGALERIATAQEETPPAPLLTQEGAAPPRILDPACHGVVILDDHRVGGDRRLGTIEGLTNQLANFFGAGLALGLSCKPRSQIGGERDDQRQSKCSSHGAVGAEANTAVNTGRSGDRPARVRNSANTWAALRRLAARASRRSRSSMSAAACLRQACICGSFS